MGIHEKIRDVMRKVEYLAKDMRVQHPGANYKAISEEMVTTAVRTAMVEVGLVIYPKSQIVTVIPRGAKGGKDRDDITQVEVTYGLADTETGMEIDVVSFGHGIDSQDKGPGKAMTYAFKYALLRTFAIPTGDDPDRVASGAIDESQPEAKTTKAKEPMKDKPEEDLFQKITSYCRANPAKFPEGIGKTMNLALDLRTKGQDKELKELWEKINA